MGRKKCDVKVSINLDNAGIDIIIISKFEKMFGTHIRKAVKDVLNEKEIKNAKVIVEDEGALDFTIKARTRTALKRIKV